MHASYQWRSQESIWYTLPVVIDSCGLYFGCCQSVRPYRWAAHDIRCWTIYSAPWTCHYNSNVWMEDPEFTFTSVLISQKKCKIESTKTNLKKFPRPNLHKMRQEYTKWSGEKLTIQVFKKPQDWDNLQCNKWVAMKVHKDNPVGVYASCQERKGTCRHKDWFVWMDGVLLP